MTAPSKANTSGLEVVAWRSTWVGHTGKTCHAYHLDKHEADDNAEHMSGASEPLVTAASAKVRIADEQAKTYAEQQCSIEENRLRLAAEARADRLVKALQYARYHVVGSLHSDRQQALDQIDAALQQETKP